MQLSVGDVFKSKNEVQNAIRMYAVDNNFNFETTDSTPKKYTIQCKERRIYGCDAIITAALRKKDNMFVIKKLKNMHNCPQQSAHTIQSSFRYIEDELREMEDVKEMRVGQIINRISLRRGIKIGYYTAWRAKKEILGEQVNEMEEEEECLKNAMEENSQLNPDDITIHSNMKKIIESRREKAGYLSSREEGFIKRVIRAIGPFDTAEDRADTLFYTSSLSLYIYKYSRQIIELTYHQRYNDLRENAGYAYFATAYDAFDSPYLLSMLYVPEYCPKKEGWIYFIKELLNVIEQGVFMIDWDDCRETIEEIEKEIEKKNGKHMFEDPPSWKGHFDIEELIRIGDMEKPEGRPKVSLFIRTRSLCKEIFSTHPCHVSIGLVWSLCNSPDVETFMIYYKKVKAQNVPSLLSLLSSIPTHLWAKYMCPYPLYNKNNATTLEIDAIHGMLALPAVDALCMAIKIVFDNAMKKKEIVSHSELTTKKTTDRARFGDAINKVMDINTAKSQGYTVCVGRSPDSVSKSSWIDPRRLHDEEEHGQGIVYMGNLRFYVDLRLKVCSCMKFQEMGYPCSHACALIMKIGGHPYSYIDETYSVDTLTQMFKPLTTRCIVNEPIRGTEERRKNPAPPKKDSKAAEDEEFSNIEYKENISVQEEK